MRTAITCLVVIAWAGFLASADERPDSEAGRAVLELVREHSQGQEIVETSNQTTTIAYDALTYQVHRPYRGGRMQTAQQELGPNTRGVVIEIQTLEGAYAGPLALPQALAGPYYATHCNQLVEGDAYYFVRARFGLEFPAGLRRRILDRIGMRAPPDRDRELPVVPVSVEARPEHERYETGHPLTVGVTLRNGLAKPIRFATFAQAPNAWNGETLGIHLVDVYRDGVDKNLFLARPTLEVPDTVSGASSHEVPQGGALRVRLDVAKWKIVGGWTPGTYDLVIRMDWIVVDKNVRLSVSSAPVRLVIE